MDAAPVETPAVAPKDVGTDSKAPAFGPAAFISKPTSANLPLTPWPRSAQWTAAVLLTALVILLACHALAGMRVGTRSSQHLDPDGPIYRLDLNRARQAELVQLPGVGPVLAERIVSFRETRGPFRAINDLRQVSGIGAKTLEKIRPWVCVESEMPAAEVLPPGAELSVAAVPRRAAPPSPRKSGKTKKEEGLHGIVININEASAGELQRLPRIGPTLSERILEERGKGRFRSVEELRRVKGIGPKTLDNLRPFITVGNDPSQLATRP